MGMIVGSSYALPIKNVGTVIFGTPYHTSRFFSDYTHIPFTNEGGEWHGNSAKGYHKTEATVEGSVIIFSYMIGFVGAKKLPPKEIVTKKLEAGNYHIKYKNPDGSLVDIGDITVIDRS